MSTVNLATIQSNTALPPTIQNSSAVEIGTFCRAWVNFNGTGTVAIRASFNVTSITDNGTGDYTVNFTTAMSDTNYSPQMTSGWTPGVTSSSFAGVNAGGVTTSTLRISNVNNVDAAYDPTNLNVAIFR